MARATKTDRKEAVKILLDLRKKRDELQLQLDDVNSRMPAAEDMVAKLLGAGLHTFGKWVVNVYSKKTGGRETPKWKAIAEAAKSAISYWQEKATEEHPESAAALEDYANHLQQAWEKGKVDNTTTGQTKHTTIVEMTKADTTS